MSNATNHILTMQRGYSLAAPRASDPRDIVSKLGLTSIALPQCPAPRSFAREHRTYLIPTITFYLNRTYHPTSSSHIQERHHYGKEFYRWRFAILSGGAAGGRLGARFHDCCFFLFWAVMTFVFDFQSIPQSGSPWWFCVT